MTPLVPAKWKAVVADTQASEQYTSQFSRDLIAPFHQGQSSFTTLDLLVSKVPIHEPSKLRRWLDDAAGALDLLPLESVLCN